MYVYLPTSHFIWLNSYRQKSRKVALSFLASGVVVVLEEEEVKIAQLHNYLSHNFTLKSY